VGGILRPRQVAESTVLDGLKLDVGKCFAAAELAATNDEPTVGGAAQ